MTDIQSDQPNYNRSGDQTREVQAQLTLTILLKKCIFFVDNNVTTNKDIDREFNESMEDVSSESSSKLWESSGSQK